jgi:hypothetical protein
VGVWEGLHIDLSDSPRSPGRRYRPGREGYGAKALEPPGGVITLAIALVINCELCGLSVQGDSEPEVLEKASGHMVERHPEAADDFSTDALRTRIQQV